MDLTFVSYLVLIAAALLVYFPVLAAGTVEDMSLHELARLYPRFTWLRKSYQYILAVLFFPLIVLAIYIIMDQQLFGDRFFLLFVPFLSAFSLFHGILARMTGIHPLWIAKSILRFWYDENRKRTWIADMQIGLAVAFIAISLLLYFMG